MSDDNISTLSQEVLYAAASYEKLRLLLLRVQTRMNGAEMVAMHVLITQPLMNTIQSAMNITASLMTKSSKSIFNNINMSSSRIIIQPFLL